MDEQRLSERIVVSKTVLHGKPRIQGTRILVHQVLDLLAAGRSIEDIISENYFPDLTQEDVLACLKYASQQIQMDTIIPNVS